MQPRVAPPASTPAGVTSGALPALRLPVPPQRAARHALLGEARAQAPATARASLHQALLFSQGPEVWSGLPRGQPRGPGGGWDERSWLWGWGLFPGSRGLSNHLSPCGPSCGAPCTILILSAMGRGSRELKGRGAGPSSGQDRRPAPGEWPGKGVRCPLFPDSLCVSPSARWLWPRAWPVFSARLTNVAEAIG